ncbi:MAG: hypothetical protein OXT09_31330 [Myxococcales bacterium]|nr:hypothetical protein [Myxococcales bacterium]
MSVRAACLVLPLVCAIACGDARTGTSAAGGPVLGTDMDSVPVSDSVSESVTRAVPAPAAAAAPVASTGPLQYLAFGGGSLPGSTEVSLEQNLLLAREVLGGPGELLFAGGAGSLSVRELTDDRPRQPSLRVRLGEIFQPRPGRDSRYRRSTLEVPAATLEAVEASLERALSEGGDPLLLYVAAHGERGDAPADNYVALWGGRGLSARALAALHERAPRPLRAVVTSCFSGGFAELAFRAADPSKGPAAAPRCGLFAGLSDRETSGCDPDPDRRRQQGYSLHFLQALAARDRQGEPLAGADLDGDGAISLLEAHARARIASRSIDVPTTTSERFLRHAVPRVPARAPRLELPPVLPEERAVVDALADALELRTLAETRRRWEGLDRDLAALDRELAAAERASDAAYQSLAAALLSRWPVLDDAYHPAFERTLADAGPRIEEALSTWPEVRAFSQAERRLRVVDARYSGALVEESTVLRLLRARETLALAATLQARGGPDLAHFERLLACERYVPPRP